jgi:spore coat polysaccharide biosynthesis protein SpsF
MKTVAIIQARMGSSRLPGKVLLDLAGQPMLTRVANRVRRATTLSDVVIATTTEPADDVLAGVCAERGWPFFRGSQDDVLDRYYRAAREYRADVVVRVTSDCPLIDGEVIDLVVSEFLRLQPGVHYAANVVPVRTYPRGLDTEVFGFASLEQAWCEADRLSWREHVTPYLYCRPDLFTTHNVVNPVDYSGLRWAVDTPEDLALVRHLYDHFGHDSFSWREAISLQDRHPEWGEINRGVQQKTF